MTTRRGFLGAVVATVTVPKAAVSVLDDHAVHLNAHAATYIAELEARMIDAHRGPFRLTPEMRAIDASMARLGLGSHALRGITDGGTE